MSSCWKYTFRPEWERWSTAYKYQPRWKLTLISNYCARVELSFSLPASLATMNITKIVCSFIDEKIQITNPDSISVVRYTRRVRRYNVVFEFYFKYGIYHTIFHLNNGKFNYDLNNCSDCELKFKIYIKVSQDTCTTSGIKIKEIVEDIQDWLYGMSATVDGYNICLFAHNDKTHVKLYNLKKCRSPIGFRICFIYEQNNILIGLNPFMEYYEQTRMKIEEIQYDLIGNGYCATDTSWFNILFEYITFRDFESNCGILDDGYDFFNNTDTNTDTCRENTTDNRYRNDIINAYDINIIDTVNDNTSPAVLDVNDNTNVTYCTFENDDCVVKTSKTDDKISCFMNGVSNNNCKTDSKQDKFDYYNHNYNCNYNCNYHRNTLDSITDSNRVGDIVGFRSQKKGTKYRYRVCKDYFGNRGSRCRACRVFQHKPNIISSCVVPVTSLNWFRYHPEIYTTNRQVLTCGLSTMQIKFSKVYPSINSKHKKNFKIWLTNRSIIPFVKNVQKNFEKHEAVENNFDFDAKYNHEDDLRYSDMIKSNHVGPRDNIYKDRYTTVMINQKYKNKKRKKKWTRTGYFDKKSNVKTKHLRKQKYQNNFKQDLYDMNQLYIANFYS